MWELNQNWITIRLKWHLVESDAALAFSVGPLVCSHCVIDLIYSFGEHSYSGYSVDNRKDLLQRRAPMLTLLMSRALAENSHSRAFQSVANSPGLALIRGSGRARIALWNVCFEKHMENMIWSVVVFSAGSGSDSCLVAISLLMTYLFHKISFRYVLIGFWSPALRCEQCCSVCAQRLDQSPEDVCLAFQISFYPIFAPKIKTHMKYTPRVWVKLSLIVCLTPTATNKLSFGALYLMLGSYPHALCRMARVSRLSRVEKNELSAVSIPEPCCQWWRRSASVVLSVIASVSDASICSLNTAMEAVCVQRSLAFDV